RRHTSFSRDWSSDVCSSDLGALHAADDPLQRNEHILAPRRPVHEGHAHGEVAVADLDAGMAGGDQRDGDAAILLLTEQMVRVIHLEGETEHGSDRGEGNIALVPGDGDAEALLPVVLPLADNTDIGHGPGIAASLWSG